MGAFCAIFGNFWLFSLLFLDLDAKILVLGPCKKQNCSIQFGLNKYAKHAFKSSLWRHLRLKWMLFVQFLVISGFFLPNCVIWTPKYWLWSANIKKKTIVFDCGYIFMPNMIIWKLTYGTTSASNGRLLYHSYNIFRRFLPNLDILTQKYYS